jgi:acetyltransferase
MSTRHLGALFAPASVAVLGASERPGSVGGAAWRNLLGAYRGRLYPVNPKHRQINGVAAYRSVKALPEAPDLAVICTPAHTVAALIAALGARGTRAAVVLSAGLSPAQTQAMLDAARVYTLRILGPGGIGMLVPHLGLNASLAHTSALPGDLALVSQSGALVAAMLDWAGARGMGFSHLVALGERADVDLADMLDFLGSDPQTRAILLCIQSIDDAPKFMSAARAAARNKPVIVVKAGRSAARQQAAAAHTGALAGSDAGSDAVLDAAIARAGMLRVDTLHELFLAAETLSRFRDGPCGPLIVLSNSGTAGAMAADAAAIAGVPLAVLDGAWLAQIDAVLPARTRPAQAPSAHTSTTHALSANPVDLGGDAPATRYVAALHALSQHSGSAVLLIHAPTALAPSADLAQALLPLVTAQPRRVLGCWLGAPAVAQARHMFRQAGVPDFNTPEEAVRALALLRTYRLHQEALLQTPPARSAAQPVDLARLRALVTEVLSSGREWLTEAEAQTFLAAAGLPLRTSRAVGTPFTEQATEHTAVQTPDNTAQHTHQLSVSAWVDPVFGPVMGFGAGGTAVDLLADRALALPPLNLPLALAQMQRARIAQQLQGCRDQAAADVNGIAQVLVAVSQLLAEVPELAELDINPLLANPEGVWALGARVRLSAACPAGAARFVIQPYPQALVETWPWQDHLLTLRPIRPEDEAQHRAFLERLDPEDIRMRVFYSRRSIEHSELARLTQIDYAREMAFIATQPRPDGGEDTLGAVRVTVDADNESAEFGVIVRSDLKGHGLGRRLMHKMIAYLRARGTQRLVGTVLRINTGMLELAHALGFQECRPPSDAHDPQTCCIALDLQAPARSHSA